MLGACNEVKSDDPGNEAEKGTCLKPENSSNEFELQEPWTSSRVRQFSLAQSIRSARQTYGNEIATIDKNGVEHTYRELHFRVASVGSALVKTCGLTPKGRVAIISLNSFRYFEYYYAVPWAGGWVVPINIRLKPADMIVTLNDCTAEMLFIDETFLRLAPLIKEGVKSLKTIVYI